MNPTIGSPTQYLQFGMQLRVSEDGKVVDDLDPAARYFRPTGWTAGTIASFFDGEATSEVGLKAGPSEDLWIAAQPDSAAVKQRRQQAADEAFETCVRGAPGRRRSAKPCATLMLAARPTRSCSRRRWRRSRDCSA